MRAITTYIYTYDELTDEAKEKAHINYLQNMDYVCSGDWEAVLNKFCELFGITMGRWEIGVYGGFYYRVQDYGHRGANGCNGIRLCKWLNNNDSYYYRWDKKFHGIEFFTEHCGLTGFCGDYNVLKPIMLCKQYKKIYEDFEELINDCLNSLFRGWLADMEYEETEEYFAELCECNEWEFDENGNMI